MQHHFDTPDSLLNHLVGSVPGLIDPLLRQKHTGLVCVIAVTAFELAIKEVFSTFNTRKHKAFGSFVGAYFYRVNGRIKLGNIRDEYLGRMGESYRIRFDKMLDSKEKKTILYPNLAKSIKSSYGNVIVWRHQFAHEGSLPTNASFSEAVDSYQLGKEVILVLKSGLIR